jgi:glycosyltransferase involved in cell wall biosynthesis
VSEARTRAAVAVIMSVYECDEPALFLRALDSLDRQDYAGGPIRIYLCVDGPVPGRIADIVASRCFYRVVRNATRLGLAHSLNRLLDSLEDECFVFRMDSDDQSRPHRITRQLAEMRRRPELDILGAGIAEVTPQGVSLRTVMYPTGYPEVLNLMTWRSPLAHPTVCFRRRAIRRFRHYPEVHAAQDWALWFRCQELGLQMGSVPEVLLDMTISENFFGRRGPKRAWEEFRIVAGGIRRTRGITWRYVHPCVRLVFRLMPTWLVRRAYASRLR